MSALLTVPELGLLAPTECAVYAEVEHRPAPLRYVWHHIVPKECGGLNVRSNLVNCCDNCHMAMHALLYRLKVCNGDEWAAWGRRGSHNQRLYTREAWKAIVLMGTVATIPNEGAIDFL